MLRQTLARDPGNAIAHDLLGNLLSSTAASMKPANASSARSRSRRCWQEATTTWSAAAASPAMTTVCCERMEAALATPGLEAAQRLRLHLAIGKAADDLGDYALAMQHFDAADDVRRGFGSFNSGRVFDRGRPPDCPLHALN